MQRHAVRFLGCVSVCWPETGWLLAQGAVPLMRTSGSDNGWMNKPQMEERHATITAHVVHREWAHTLELYTVELFIVHVQPNLLRLIVLWLPHTRLVLISFSCFHICHPETEAWSPLSQRQMRLMEPCWFSSSTQIIFSFGEIEWRKTWHLCSQLINSCSPWQRQDRNYGSEMQQFLLLAY